MKRVKADSWAARLTLDQRDELMRDYHISAISVEEAAEKASNYSDRTVSKGAFSNWYHTQRMAWMAEQARIKTELAAKEAPDDLDECKSLAIRQAAFAAAAEDLSAKDIAMLERNDIARRKLELEKRRLALDEAKFASAERKAKQLEEAAEEIKATGGLSPETLEKIEQAANLL
ncbi:MAG: hypothetical protein JW739_05700 [Opitutales bacterium]|nr:hypothetical protein [Opitutales bacterium]